MTFGEVNPDTQKKLQKVEGALGMPVSHLVEIAFKVFHGKNQVQEKREQWRAK